MHEYKTLTASTPATPEQLNEFAEEGWELVQILEWRNELLHYFQRAKVN